MKPRSDPGCGALALLLCFWAWTAAAFGQTTLQFSAFQRLSNQEMFLRLTSPTGLNYRVDVSSNLLSWNSLLTFFAGSNAFQHTDSAAPFLASRLYRALQLDGSNIVTGEHLTTANGDLILHRVYHAAVALSWAGRMVYVDPSTNRFAGLPLADLILFTHPHGDHFNASAITGLRASNGIVVAPQAVYDSLSTAQKSNAMVLSNSVSTNLFGVGIEAVAMYNTNASPLHPKGWGNGYVLSFADKRVYLSGDTDNTPEMRALPNIDIAFLCLRGPPPNMDVPDALRAVRAFRPRVVYPYHYTTNTPARFKEQLGTDLGIEVRLRDWYAKP